MKKKIINEKIFSVTDISDIGKKKQRVNRKDLNLLKRNINLENKIRSVVRSEIKKLNEATYGKHQLKKDYMASRDLEKDEKSLTNFLKKEYQTLMKLSADNKALSSFLNKGMKKLHVSDTYKDNMLDKIKDNNEVQNMKYLTNALLKGKGLGLGRIK